MHEQVGWVSRSLHWVTKTILKRYDANGVTFSKCDEQTRGCHRLGVEGGCNYKGTAFVKMEQFCTLTVVTVVTWIQTCNKIYRTRHTHEHTKESITNWWDMDKLYSSVNSVVPTLISCFWKSIFIMEDVFIGGSWRKDNGNFLHCVFNFLWV